MIVARHVIAAGLCLALGSGAALAQATTPAAPAATSPAAAPPAPAGPAPAGTAAAPPGAPAPATDQAGPAKSVLSLSASLTGDTKPLRSGMVWRIFDDKGGDTTPNLVARSTAANPSFSLVAGNYIVHAAYGFATATSRVALGQAPRSEQLSISAGALRLGGVIGDLPIPANKLSFAIYLPVGNDSEGRLVLGNVKAGELVRLPEGSYRVVSTYGDSNAIMRTDLKVEPGRLTEATLNHRAATVTLKLVANAGGEAFAGTAFSVLTPGGDVIREAIGAFPTVTLAEGDYVLIARHDGRVYTRDFKVESGLDRDIEVLVKSDAAKTEPAKTDGAQSASAAPAAGSDDSALVPRQRP
jgi:hypothetical protein